MIVKIDTNIKNFVFWSGGADNASLLDNSQLNYIESLIEELYPDGINEITLNDLMWFDFDWIKEQLKQAGMPVKEV